MSIEMINGYRVIGELKTTNSGFSRWGFVMKGAMQHYIKEFIDPVYPVYEDVLSPGMVAHKRRICEAFEARSRQLYWAINECSDGNLVPIEDFFRWKSHYYLVMEKTLAIDAREVLSLPRPDLIRICKVLIHSLGALHARGIVHGDIKLDNILFCRLVSGRITAKIIDFDNCFWESRPPRPDEEIHGDLVYLAPETFMMMQTEEGTVDRAIDVFALGIVIHQLFTGELPMFDTANYSYPFEAVVAGDRLGVSEKVPEALRDPVALMLEGHPDRRIALDALGDRLRQAAPTKKAPPTCSFFVPGGDL